MDSQTSVPANEQAPLVEPEDCVSCKNPSKGGRKRCCGRAICQSCFDKETNDTCSICSGMFAAFVDVLDPMTGEIIKMKTSCTGGYYLAHEKPRYVPTEDQDSLIKLINTMARPRKTLRVYIHGPPRTGKAWIAQYIAYQHNVYTARPYHQSEGEAHFIIDLPEGKRIYIVISRNPPPSTPGVSNGYDAVFKLTQQIPY